LCSPSFIFLVLSRWIVHICSPASTSPLPVTKQSVVFSVTPILYATVRVKPYSFVAYSSTFQRPSVFPAGIGLNFFSPIKAYLLSAQIYVP
jgi:hypothetical protein